MRFYLFTAVLVCIRFYGCSFSLIFNCLLPPTSFITFAREILYSLMVNATSVLLKRVHTALVFLCVCVCLCVGKIRSLPLTWAVFLLLQRKFVRDTIDKLKLRKDRFCRHLLRWRTSFAN